MNIDRKLVSLRVVSGFKPIDGADQIELAIIDGWQVVVRKDEFTVGEKVLYLEIDSWVPTTLAPFLSKGKTPKVFEGVPGEKLRTIKLKGALSQGLLLKVPDDMVDVPEDFDYAANLGVFKWEKPLPAQLAGMAKGNFPTFIPKTDQNRIQNVYGYYEYNKDLFEVTEKLDGSSMTVYKHNEVFGVCSRNLDLKETEGNTFWDIARKLNLEAMLPNGIALQGELVGPGIQGNPYGLQNHRFIVFDIYKINEQVYMAADRRQLFLQMRHLESVPILGVLPMVNLNAMLEYADGNSIIGNTKREGVVWKSTTDPQDTFKVISNEWLLGNKE